VSDRRNTPRKVSPACFSQDQPPDINVIGPEAAIIDRLQHRMFTSTIVLAPRAPEPVEGTPPSQPSNIGQVTMQNTSVTRSADNVPFRTTGNITSQCRESGTFVAQCHHARSTSTPPKIHTRTARITVRSTDRSTKSRRSRALNAVNAGARPGSVQVLMGPFAGGRGHRKSRRAGNQRDGSATVYALHEGELYRQPAWQISSC
jgi:hypothetical protein